MQSNQQLVATFINLDQSFNNLQQLRLKGKKMVQEIANCFYQRQILRTGQSECSSIGQKLLYNNAISNCNGYLGRSIVLFEQNFLKSYKANVQILSKNIIYLKEILSQNTQPVSTHNNDTLFLQLLQLGVSLCHQYQLQLNLIHRHWIINTSDIFTKQYQTSNLKELMLHIGFQSQVNYDSQESWRVKLFALSNLRYNPKKS